MSRFDRFMWWLTEGGYVVIMIAITFCFIVRHFYISRQCESKGGIFIQSQCLKKDLIKLE